jgi:hypothetical protein
MSAPKIVSLPEIARLTGAHLDVLRRHAPALASQGLLCRVGNGWAAEAANAHAIRAAAEAASAAKKVRK